MFIYPTNIITNPTFYNKGLCQFSKGAINLFQRSGPEDMFPRSLFQRKKMESKSNYQGVMINRKEP